jgi:hypothetical protein
VSAPKIVTEGDCDWSIKLFAGVPFDGLDQSARNGLVSVRSFAIVMEIPGPRSFGRTVMKVGMPAPDQSQSRQQPWLRHGFKDFKRMTDRDARADGSLAACTTVLHLVAAKPT